jgi:hypothetical protein
MATHSAAILYELFYLTNAREKTPALSKKSGGFGACGRTRTGDLRITNALLYQLSHTSK